MADPAASPHAVPGSAGPPLARTILIIDDEPQIRRAVRNALAGVAERISEAATGADGLDRVAAEQPDLVVLDLGLPDIPGMTVCQEIRRWAVMPIVVLSARHSDQEKVDLLNAGADDYVTKPFSTLELAARVRAQLRRAQPHVAPAPALLPLPDGLVVDFPRRTVSRDGTPIRLTPLEWDIFHALLRQAGRTLTHQQIFAEVWQRPYGSPQQYLRVHITNLRRKIELNPAQPQLIVTDPGVGYRFELPR